MITRVWKQAQEKWERDRDLPLRFRLDKGLNYVLGMASAPWRLRSANRVGKGVRTTGGLKVSNYGQLEIGDHVILISSPCPIELATSPGARLRIGAHSIINYGVSLGATGSIEIGQRVLIGPFGMVIDNTFHEPYDRTKQPLPKPVVIEDDVFIGAKVSVMPGVTIGKGAIVATGAVVTKDVAPFTVVAGVPAKKVSDLDPARFAQR